MLSHLLETVPIKGVGATLVVLLVTATVVGMVVILGDMTQVAAVAMTQVVAVTPVVAVAVTPVVAVAVTDTVSRSVILIQIASRKSRAS
ncbi:hypothetical protein FNW02_17065 [Komarekiella sp. 'clone 1']|uniref:Uncharacterized protein n=1 Tax=Komarekiella delphini-convector SJRDD-AB1 TaxID=2593771 RepID=A0AA40SYU0_9NOST|nr:hypothetical protein [Komarekiella delphini-convector]MBD6617488.1 hypothetical protein [Komarekiella delphini-convector SJRDD-AB1]